METWNTLSLICLCENVDETESRSRNVFPSVSIFEIHKDNPAEIMDGYHSRGCRSVSWDRNSYAWSEECDLEPCSGCTSIRLLAQMCLQLLWVGWVVDDWKQHRNFCGGTSFPLMYPRSTSPILIKTQAFQSRRAKPDKICISCKALEVVQAFFFF